MSSKITKHFEVAEIVSRLGPPLSRDRVPWPWMVIEPNPSYSLLTLLRCLSLHRVTSPTTTFPQGIRMQFTVVFCAMAAFVSIADGDCVDGYGWACDDGQGDYHPD